MCTNVYHVHVVLGRLRNFWRCYFEKLSMCAPECPENFHEVSGEVYEKKSGIKCE